VFDGKRVLAVVPARGGSTGVELKNLREIGGVSLVARAARVAIGLAFVDAAIVSTDHAGIAKAARDAGLRVPFRRPDALSGPLVSDLEVLSHALVEMEREDRARFDVIVMLQPTSPSRTPDHVLRCIEKLVAGAFDSVWTVSLTDSKEHPLKQLMIGPHDELEYYDQRGAQIIARQQLAPVYHRNGIAYAITRNCLVEQKSIKGARCGALLVEEPVVNIDTELDLLWAEFLHRDGRL